MEDLIPLEDIVEENVRVQELEKQGFIINPEKIDSYFAVWWGGVRYGKVRLGEVRYGKVGFGKVRF